MTIDALETLLSGYKHWRDIGNDALIGGLIAEVVVIAVVSEHWKYKWTCELAAGIVVLVGVWTEVTYSGYADEIERQIRQQSNKQIALLNREAGYARKDAADARLETERIKARIAWRELDPKQKASIALRLAPFAGEHADLTWYPEAIEAGTLAAKTFAESIKSALTASGWTVSDSSQIAGSNDMPEIAGVLVLTMPNDKSEEVGSALVKALWSEQIVASVEPLTKYFPLFAKTIDRHSGDSYATRVIIVVGNHL